MFYGLRVVTSRFGGIRWFHIIEHYPNWSAIARRCTFLSFSSSSFIVFSLFGHGERIRMCSVRPLRRSRRLTTGDAVLTRRTDPERSSAQKSPTIYANKCIAMKVKSQSTERRTDERRTSEWEGEAEERQRSRTRRSRRHTSGKILTMFTEHLLLSSHRRLDRYHLLSHSEPYRSLAGFRSDGTSCARLTKFQPVNEYRAHGQLGARH